jgi:hypothetical protein
LVTSAIEFTPFTIYKEKRSACTESNCGGLNMHWP